MSSENVVIEVAGLGKRYEIYANPRDRLKQLVAPHLQRAANIGRAAIGMDTRHEVQYFREFWALRDVSFQIERGETFGIIGRNGSGKSTLLQILADTLTPTEGTALVNGRVAALLELGSGFNPEFTGEENVFLNGRILGLNRKEIEDRYDRICAFADIGEFLQQPVKTYSSGMFVRLAFAVQAHIDASIVIIDEALAVGDVFFRQKCYSRLEQLRDAGSAILLVSHSMPDIEQYCKRALLLDHGSSRFIGTAAEAAKHYYLRHQQPASISAGEQADAVDNRIRNSSIVSRTDDEYDTLPWHARIDLSTKSQIGTGQARCSALALCDAAGHSANSFQQADVAVFHYEFELYEDIGVPVCGLLLTNERGVIVHGKNAWQHHNEQPTGVTGGKRIICRQEIGLQLAPGEYTFEIGLAAVTQAQWDRRHDISHEQWSGSYRTVCVVTQAGQLSISLATRNGIAVLTHHGVADLPGRLQTRIEK